MKSLLLLPLFCLIAAAQPNPSPQAVDGARRANYCSDPWITLAIWEITANTRNPSGIGSYGECNPQRYNGGSWQGYAQLRRAVDETVRTLSVQGVTDSLRDNRNRTLTLETRAGAAVDRLVVTGSVVSQGGGNVVSQGGGNIVSHDGGTLITQDATRSIQSASQVKVKLPGGRAMVIGR